MTVPFYVSPEQWYQDKAEYARKGIARGKPIVALDYADGIVLIAENRSANLRKLAEIYDRIGFAAVGRFDEYDNLRKAGVRYADLKGYSWSRDDVAAANLANEFSSVLGGIFTREMKPLEVEILLCEVGDSENAYFRIQFYGFMSDQKNFHAIGGDVEPIQEALRRDWKPGLSLPQAVKLGCQALGRVSDGSSKLDENSLEIAILDRGRPGRKFRRLGLDEIRTALSEAAT